MNGLKPKAKPKAGLAEEIRRKLVDQRKTAEGIVTVERELSDIAKSNNYKELTKWLRDGWLRKWLKT